MAPSWSGWVRRYLAGSVVCQTPWYIFLNLIVDSELNATGYTGRLVEAQYPHPNWVFVDCSCSLDIAQLLSLLIQRLPYVLLFIIASRRIMGNGRLDCSWNHAWLMIQMPSYNQHEVECTCTMSPTPIHLGMSCLQQTVWGARTINITELG